MLPHFQLIRKLQPQPDGGLVSHVTNRLSRMLTPAAKRRRRAETATATLSRPFRSPAVHRGGAAGMNSPKEAHKTQDTETKGVTERTASVSATLAKDELLATAASPARVHKRRRPPDQLKEAPKPMKQDPALSLSSLMDQFSLDLDAGDKILEDARTSAKKGPQQQKETAARAKETHNSRGDDDSNKGLRLLIVLWKQAGRLAAEDVFSIVSERVARAGGVKAWRAMAFQQPDEDSGSNRRSTRRQRNDRDEDDSGNESVQDEEENDYEAGNEENENIEDEAEESQVSLALLFLLTKSCPY